MSKWFRSTGDDSEDDDSEEESDSEATTSDDDSSSGESGESGSDDSDESDDVKEAQPKASRFLKGAQKDDDSDDDKGDIRVVSKDTKRNVELEKLYNSLKEKMKINDIKAVQDDVDRLVKKFGATDMASSNMFLKSMVHTDRWLRDREAKEKAKDGEVKKDKEKQKALGLLKQKIKKVLGKEDLKARLKKIESVLDKEERGGGEDDDDDASGEDDDNEDLLVPADKRDKDRAEEEEKEWKPEVIERKLQEVLSLRGKRGQDKMESIEQLKRILAHTAPTMPTTRLQLVGHLVAAWFDYSPSTATHIPANSWRHGYDNILKVFNVMAENPSFVLREAEDDLGEVINTQKLPEAIIIPMEGNLLSFTERLDDEFTKALQFTDPHTQAYVERLADEPYLMDCLERAYHYYKSRDLHKHAARMAAKMLDHLYYRRQGDHVKMLAKQRIQTDQRRRKMKKQDEEEEKRVLAAAEAAMEAEAAEEEVEEGGEKKSKVQSQPFWSLSGNLADSMARYMKSILTNGDEKAKARALLCKVYHLALHDQYTQARDIVLMSHIHEIVTSANPAFQILFNRVLAQLGMAAFRLGQFKDVHVCLNELCATQRVKELLAQGIPNPKYVQDRKPEEERQNKMKLCPFHMHINLDVLETVSLVSAMILEIPMMAANPYDAKRKVQSKAFNKLLHNYESQVFLGPPENTRDHLYAASKALLIGDWEKCYELISSLPVWDLVPTGEKIKAMLQQKIKEEGLRAYLLQYAQFYETVSLESMSSKFQLTNNIVHSVVSKMMFNEEVAGSWDQPAGCIRIHNTNPSKLQYLCLMLAEKAQILVENNEKILDQRGGGFGATYKMGQDVKPTRPNETLWGNFNRWSGVGGGSTGGMGGMRRQHQGMGGGGRGGSFTQIGGRGGGGGNRQQYGNNRGYGQQGGGGFGGGGGGWGQQRRNYY